METAPPETLRAIQDHFHALIRTRAARPLEEHPVPLPDLSTAPHGKPRKGWLPIPGMAGGFAYWFAGEGAQATLITESWSRVAEGSGQRHEITADACRLVEEGFI